MNLIIQKEVIDVNIKPQTIKLLGKTIGENLCNLQVSKYILSKTQKQLIEEKMGKLDFIKIKNFYSLKTTVKRIKIQDRD